MKDGMASIPAIDQKGHDNIKTATFSMGCFWGPDALFGAQPGVVRTSVGYAGGKKENPTYQSLGDHTETVQIVYDEDDISYKELLDIFWSGHDAARPKSTQYKSIIFFHDEEQEESARKSKEDGMTTEIREYSRYYLAEEYHQKYNLRLNKSLYNSYRGIYPDMKDFISSTAVARVNGYIAGKGNLTSKDDLKNLGLNKEWMEILYNRWNAKKGKSRCYLR